MLSANVNTGVIYYIDVDFKFVPLKQLKQALCVYLDPYFSNLLSQILYLVFIIFIHCHFNTK